MDSEVLKSLSGGPELLDWFGRTPSFHDAEILSIAFDRAVPTCVLRLHAFEMTGATNAEGFYILEGHAVVTFTMAEVTEMQLEGFNHQNVLMALEIKKMQGDRLRIDLDTIYGLTGHIEGRSIAVSIQPGIPPGSQYAADRDLS